MKESVAPLAGAWIETKRRSNSLDWIILSHPSRVRGLKPALGRSYGLLVMVAPLAGAWIETGDLTRVAEYVKVAPLAGAWIETSKSR